MPGYPGLGYPNLHTAEANGAGPIARLPYSLRVLVENLLRHGENPRPVTARSPDRPVAFRPARVMLQDSAGLPVLADLAALTEAVRQRGGDPAAVTPRLPMDLIVDHAVEADHWARGDAAELNLRQDYRRNHDRYRFLRWAAARLPGLNVVPPGVGICHQLNLEVLADVVTRFPGGLAGFDSVLGTDSHTTMVNALGVLGWGVGGIEATAAVLGEPVWLPVPEVVGVRLVGELSDGVLAADLALNLTSVLREHGVVQRFVEFCGPGLAALSVPDRATVSNMAPEYGATTGFFPPDERTLDYLRDTARTAAHVEFVAAYLRAQGMLYTGEPEFTELIEFDLGSVGPTIAGPSRPSQRLSFADLPATVPSRGAGLSHGDVVLAAITSCTNTSNPRAVLAAGLLARAAVRRGLRVPARVKTTFSPGSQVTARMLERTGLQADLDELRFHVAGFGCMTCMGNSGPLDPAVEREVSEKDLSVAAVLSGNRNFDGRVHPLCRLAYLASPPLVVAFALAGRVDLDLATQPLGEDPGGTPVYLADLWPSGSVVDAALSEVDFSKLAGENLAAHAAVLAGWETGEDAAEQFVWDGPAGFIRRPPFLDGELASAQLAGELRGARPLLVLGDAVTTDHISPVSRIAPDSEAGRWLGDRGVDPFRHASFSARRLNHEVMLRGGFAHPRLDNLLAPGGRTMLLPDGEVLPVHQAAAVYRERGVPVVIVAGEGYGAGSARDWAAKVTRLLGVRAVLARGFERIHRTNLLAMGVLPLRLPARAPRLNGTETLDLLDLAKAMAPGGHCTLRVHREGAPAEEFRLASMVLTTAESEWLRAGGLLPKILGKALDL